MKHLIYFATLALGILPAASSAAAQPVQAETRSDSATINPDDLRSEAKANRAFGVRLYKQLAAKPGNLFISPISIGAAFGPVALGARADTYMAIGRTLGFRPDPQILSKRVEGLLRTLETDGEGAKVSIANALWLTDRHPTKPDYVSLVGSNFGADVATLDFIKSAAAAARINRWVDKETAGKIPKLFEPDAFDDKTALVVTNAVHFLGDWAQPFNAQSTRPAPFFLGDGKQKSVPMMTGEKSLRYLDTGKLQLIDLPYEGDALSMVAILPKGRDGLAALEAQMTGDTLDKWIGQLDSAEVQSLIVQMPKLTFEGDYNLVGPLKALGMGIAFDRLRANFRGMSDEQLYISDVVHKTFVRIDEKGTEAAAATGVVMSAERSGPDLLFRADHPFLLLIRENRTGAILFFGRIVEP